MDEGDFDRIVSGFYAAATGEIGWSEALAPMAGVFGAQAAAVQTLDRTTGRILQLSLGGPLPRQATLDYLRTWHLKDPRRHHLIRHSDALLDRWWFCNEHFDESFTRDDPFYMHFLPAYETRYLATALLSPAPDLLTAFALELPAGRGPLDDDERQVVRRLGHHAREALRQYERVRKMAGAALAGHRLLDTFPYPMWLLDEHRAILYANAGAQDPATIGERTRVVEGRLQLVYARADRQFSERLARLSAKPHGTRTLVDARARASDAISWLHLARVEPMQVLGAFGDRPLVMATLFSSDRLTKLDAYALAEVFELTPAQARVAVLVADGITAEEIATKLGCGVPTVRTHVAHVMSKIGAKRMADAIRILRQGEALWSAGHG